MVSGKFMILGRFAVQRKLHNSIKVQMGGGNSAGNLLTMCILKNTDAARLFP